MDDLKRPGTTPEANITVGGPNGVKNTPVSAQLTNRKLANARRAITDALNSRRVKPSKLIFISLAAVIIVAGVSFYFVHNQKSTGSAVLTATGQTCGVHLNSNGTFTFSWLHINSTGQVVDSTGCVVRLLGVNEGAPFLGGASGTTDLAGLAAKMKWYHNALPANIARVNYNAYWWDTDAYVPDAHMHFKQWLQTYVKLLEQSGDYVELDTGPEFHNPPCGNDGMGVNITFCPSQNQATKNIPTNPQEQIWYEPTALQSLSELSKIYANDPAILFNVWNEPAASAITLTQYMTDMNERINAVRANAKNSICVVYVRYLDQIMAGQAQLYTQPNLIIDQHDYGVPNVAALQPKFAYYKAHGLGAIFNEYGGAIYNPAAEPVFTQLAQQYGVGLVYFFYSNLNSATTQNPTNALNANGQLVHQSYTTIFGSAPPAPSPSPNPSPSPAPNPTPNPSPSPTPTPSPSPTPSPKPGKTVKDDKFFKAAGIKDIDTSRVTIFWHTSSPAETEIKIGSKQATTSKKLTKFHEITATNLRPHTKYTFVLMAKDARGVTHMYKTMTFTTK